MKPSKYRMTNDREDHLAGILERFNERYPVKYRKGQAEHGGKLENRDGLFEAEDEVLDLWSYIQIERSKKCEVLKILTKHARGALSSRSAMSMIKNVLFP